MFQLRDYQQPHAAKLLEYLKKYGSALDASDTGTGKTYVALQICKALQCTPLVVSSKASRAGWESAAESAGVQVEFVNYEKLRGRRSWGLAPCPRCEENNLPILGPYREKSGAESEWLVEVKWGKGSFLRWKQEYYLIIFDEVHRCSGATSLNSKCLISAKRQSKYLLCLSATAADDPRQMKALGYAIDQHSLSRKVPGRKSWMSWLMSHGCSPGTFGGFAYTTDEARQKKVFTKLHTEIFSSRGARMRKSEIPGFPQTIITTLLISEDDNNDAKELSEKLHGISDKPETLAERMLIRQKLELLKVPYLVDACKDHTLNAKVVIFVNFTATLWELKGRLEKEYKIGLIWGGQTGTAGEVERADTLSEFQKNHLDILLCNVQAGGESANMHDPEGLVERVALISPCDSGRQLKQVFGRVNRDGGARSVQYVVAFKGTYEEIMAERVAKKIDNLDTLNDADLRI